MILLDIFKVKKNHSGNQKVVEKVHQEYWHTGLVFRFGEAIVGLVFSCCCFFSCDRSNRTSFKKSDQVVC